MPIVAHSFKTPTPADALAGHDGTSNWSPRMFALADVLNLATQQITTQIAQATIGITQTTADRTGATDATNQLVADLAAAQASGHRRLYLPAGTYRLTLAHQPLPILQMTANGTEMFGDGMGKTVLLLDSGLTITNDLTIVQLTGRNQTVRDLTIKIGSGYSGAKAIAGVSVYDGCFGPTIARVEVDGGYSGGTSSGFGIGTYQAWSTPELSTTLGTDVVPGAQVVSPGSMAGIYVGRRLQVGGAGAESVVVTARTLTTFTATFANAHAAAAVLTAYCQGNQYALIEDCYVHDGYTWTAFGANSCNNVFRRNRVVAEGATVLWHGFYIQGGQNRFEQNYVAGVSGYCFHSYKQVPNIDGSGDVYIGNVTVNPQEGGHYLIQSVIGGNVDNPEVPVGGPLTRYAAYIGNTLRNTNGKTSTGITSFGVPILVVGNMIEDIVGTSGSGVLELATDCVATGNTITETGNALLAGVPNYCGIRCTGSRAIVVGNTIDLKQSPAFGIRMPSGGGGNIVQGNSIYVSGANSAGIAIDGARQQVIGNRIEASVSGQPLLAAGVFTDLQFRENVIVAPTSAASLDLTNCSGVFANNTWTGVFEYSNLNQQVIFTNNAGRLVRSGQAGSTLDGLSGNLVALGTDGTAESAGRLVKLTATGIALLGVADVNAVAVTTTAASAAAQTVLLITQPGAVAPIDCDGAWTAGHIGIPSTTTGGKIHDSGGVTAPASGSYGVFLDSGGGAGVARVLLVKTL